MTRPQLVYPEHRVSLTDTQALALRVYGHEPGYPVIARMVMNTTIAERRMALPIEQIERLAGLEQRTALYVEHARPLVRAAVDAALQAASLAATEIDLLITTSCTGFVMPGLDVYLINELGMRSTIRRMPFAQLGCVAGAMAMAAAVEHCRAHPHARVLIAAVELCSLCFFPERKDLSSAVCASIFADGAAACIVSGSAHGDRGLLLDEPLDYLLPDSPHYIRFDVLERGYHLGLDRAVMRTVPELAPVIREFLGDVRLDFVVAHTGGRRILDGLAQALAVDAELLGHSRASLREYGNTASVSVFDVLARCHDDLSAGAARDREQHGMVVAFGPGFSMSLLRARWRG